MAQTFCYHCLAVLPLQLICTEKKTILSVEDILGLIGDRCDGVIGQLTEDWGATLFSALSSARGKAFSNMAVGYNNVDVEAAKKYGVAVGNTPIRNLKSEEPMLEECAEQVKAQ